MRREPSRAGAKPAPRRVLIAARDRGVGGELQDILERGGIETSGVDSLALLFEQLAQGGHDVVIVDLGLPTAHAGLVPAILECAPASAIIALTSATEPELGVQAVRAGATDFVRTPLDRDEVRYVFAKSLRLAEFAEAEAPSSLRVVATTQLIGGSKPMLELSRTLARAANGIATVLVRGESGSGKELVARRLHEQSPRAQGPFVKVHCGALPDNLLESELFGYEKGAFTGAVARKPGRVELAQGGTLFLDEIGDITPAVQVKLLRVLQDREFEPLGGTRTIKADVRFVTATHRDLESLAAKGEFRQDLLYRLNVISLWVPPLRARPEDIEPLALHFCAAMAQANGRGAVVLDVDALDLLKRQAWPGNVRQLQNFVERLVVLAERPRISAEDVRRELERQAGTMGFAVASGFAPPVSKESSLTDLNAALRKAERRALDKALRSANGNRTVAARLLGISVRSLYYKLEEHQLH